MVSLSHGKSFSNETSNESSSSAYDQDDEEKLLSLRLDGGFCKLQTELMQACADGHEQKVARLIAEGADPHLEDSHSSIRPAVYIATRNGHLNVLKYLVQHHSGDVYHTTTRRTTLLHLAARRGHVNIVRWLAIEKGLNTSATNKHGGTPLHLACESGHLNVVKFLVDELRCDPQYTSTTMPESPLHTACMAGREKVLRYLLETCNCDRKLKTQNGETLLHLAAQRGYKDIVEYLIVDQKLDPNERTNRQYTALHLASQSNKPDIVRYLVTIPECAVNTRTKNGSFSPLHIASKYGRLEVVKALLNGGRVEPLLRAEDGSTSLHLASKSGHRDVVKYLLKEQKFKPSVRGPHGRTPIQIAEKHDVIKTLIHYGANPKESPIDLFPHVPKMQMEDIVRIMVIGDPSTGKSTLVEALKILPATGIFKSLKRKGIKNVAPCTPGIVPHELSGSEFGRVLLFDFAGQSEYYTSHAVVMESAVSTTAPIFLVVVDLSRKIEDVKRRVYYWVSFIENVRPSLKSRPYLVIVGSHHDVVSKKYENSKLFLQQVEHSVDHILSSSSLNYAGYYSVDCTSPPTQRLLRECLKSSCSALRTNSEDDRICHAFYAFMCDEFEGKIMVTLKDVAIAIERSNQPFPLTPQHLCELCERATNIANIMLFKNSMNTEDSSIVLEVKTLLSRIQAVLFAPQEFLSIESSLNADTGIISFAELARTFPDFDDERLKVIIQFMERLEIGQRIGDKQTLQLIMRGNPPPEAAHVVQNGPGDPHDLQRDGRNHQFLFLPPLIDEHRPIGIWRPHSSFTYHTGWCLQCSLDIQQFPPRCLHALLLRIAFSFAVANQDGLQVRPTLGRECTLWKNGIHWLDLNGIETIVEVIEEGQVIAMAMRCIHSQEVECIKLRAAVIKTILETKQLYASQIATDEFVLSPDSLQKDDYPIKSIDHKSAVLYSVNMIAHSLIKGYPCVKRSRSEELTRINSLMFWDPYLGLGESLLKELFDEDRQESQLSNDFLFKFSQKQAESWFILGFHVFHLDRATLEIIKDRSDGREDYMCMHVMETFCQRDVTTTVRSLRSELDKFSIFCGRNILVSSYIFF